ncbi:MAG TPA: rRNA maturation RNase YbeY [Cyclobacteriaceae bacterium]|jgi:rRNA maturation RNase YbeY|nr:rRNA maturation RNase YbeY [Cyclobacteriaceae bacterium]
MPIRFFYEETKFKIVHPRKTVKWIIESARREKRLILDINYIFCSDDYLLGLNKEFLDHNTFTDIITFDSSEGKNISGEIYISLDRVRENSLKFNSHFNDELLRVMIHGVLHLTGYKDKKPREISTMRKKEEAYLSLWKTMFHVKQ